MGCNQGGCHGISRECCMSDTCIYCDESCGGNMEVLTPSKEAERLKLFKADRQKMHNLLWGNDRHGSSPSDTTEFHIHLEGFIKSWKDLCGERNRLLPVVEVAKDFVKELDGKTGLTPTELKLRQEVAKFIAVTK